MSCRTGNLMPKVSCGKGGPVALHKAGNFTHKKIPGAKARGIFLFHLIVIVLIQASCEVEEGRGVGGVD